MTEQPTDPSASGHDALPDEPIPDAGGGTHVGVHRGVLDQDVNAAALCRGLVHQVLQLLLVADMAGDDDRLPALGLDAVCNRLARVGLAAGDDDGGTVLRHAGGDGEADTLG